MVYYYNTEQDRDNNQNEMQAVLDTYGVAAVPALVVWADAGETQEIYFNEDIVDYFLDTDRFNYWTTLFTSNNSIYKVGVVQNLPATGLDCSIVQAVFEPFAFANRRSVLQKS